MESEERRLKERFELQIQAKLSTDADTSEVVISEEVTATNISSGGAFLETSRKIPLASRVKLEFFVNLEQLKKLRFILALDTLKNLSGDTIWIKASGVVIRQEKDGVGIIFNEDYQLSPMQSSDSE